MFKTFKASHVRRDDWNIVFVSCDRDEAAGKDYFKVRILSVHACGIRLGR